MRSGRRALIVTLVLVISLTSVFAAVGCKKETVVGKTLRVAFSAAPDAIDVVGYKMMEILRGEGVAVDVMFLDGGQKAVMAILANQVDIAAAAIDGVVLAQMTAFALSRPRNLYAMVGSKGMTKVEDIVGRVMGAPDPGSVATSFEDAVFAKYGIAPESYSRLQIGGAGARTQALLSGRVDAVFVYGGKHVTLKKAGYPTLTTVNKEFPGMHDDMWSSTKTWLENNELLAVAICRAQIQAAIWFHEKPDEWLAMALELVEIEEADARELYALLLEMDMYPVDGLMTLETLGTTADFFAATETIPDVPVEQWATVQYMDQAREELGIK